MGYLFGVLATFGGNVQRLRDRAGFKTAKSLADALQVAASVVSRWENDLTGLPEAPTLLKIAKTVRCSVEELLDGVDPDYQQMLEARSEAKQVVDDLGRNEADLIDIDISQYVEGDIPVLGYAEATTDGLIAWTDEGIVRKQVEQWISRPSWIRDKKAYALIVRGDSMIPRYLPGELIIASPNAVVSSGAYACVILKNGERMIKQVYKEQSGWNLISTNTKISAWRHKSRRVARTARARATTSSGSSSMPASLRRPLTGQPSSNCSQLAAHKRGVSMPSSCTR